MKAQNQRKVPRESTYRTTIRTHQKDHHQGEKYSFPGAPTREWVEEELKFCPDKVHCQRRNKWVALQTITKSRPATGELLYSEQSILWWATAMLENNRTYRCTRVLKSPKIVPTFYSSLPYWTKFRRTKMSKIRLAAENFFRRKFFPPKYFVHWNSAPVKLIYNSC